jgi:hypothetical protein
VLLEDWNVPGPVFPQKTAVSAHDGFILRGAFLRNPPEIQAKNAFWDGH